jgi:hypothetical protein
MCAGLLDAVKDLAALVDAGALLPEIAHDLVDAHLKGARRGYVWDRDTTSPGVRFHELAYVDAAKAPVAERGRGASASLGEIELASRGGGGAGQILQIGWVIQTKILRLRSGFPWRL